MTSKTEPIDPSFCFNCKVCGAQEEMTWGEDNELCETCKKREFVNESVPVDWTQVTEVRLSSGQRKSIAELISIADFYSNPDNWRRFPMDTGIDANGSPVEQYCWIGDGGDVARKLLGEQ